MSCPSSHAGTHRAVQPRAEWAAAIVEPLLTLGAFLALVAGSSAALGADGAPDEGERVAITFVAAFVAQLLFTLGHGAGLDRPVVARAPAVVARLRIFLRFLVFHLPMFLSFGRLPDLSPVPMLDFQLVSVVFAIGGHRVVRRAEASAPSTPAHRTRRMADVLPITAVVGLAAALRLHDLDYNGPFIDESFYAYARELGNVFFIASDSRLWPMLSAGVYSAAGLVGVRATTALLGVLTVLCVYRFARCWSAELDPGDAPGPGGAREQHHRHVALVAAFLTAVAAPTLLTSVVGRHDALAFLAYAFALSQIALAARQDRPVAMLLGAAALLLALWVRYALMTYLPLGMMLIVYAQVARRNAYLEALLPVALMGLIWVAFDLQHWLVAWDHSRRTIHAGPAAIALETCARIPFLLAAAGMGTAGLVVRATHAADGRVRRLAAIALAALGTVGIVAAHVLVARTALSLDRNLSLAVLFGSVLAGWFVVTVAQRIPGRGSRHVVIAAGAVALTLHAWSMVEREKRSWPDPRPVVAAVARALERYDLGPDTVVWSTDDGGGKGNVHALVLGLRGEAVVDYSSPWKPLFWQQARDQDIPLLAGTNRRDPQHGLAPGTVVQGYVVAERVPVPHGPDAHVYVRRDLWKAAGR